MRVLGLDIGEKRIGVAVSDREGRVATPVKVLAAHDTRALRSLIEEYGAGMVVAGLPLAMDGGEGVQARRVREFADALARDLPVPLRYFDERLTSVQARRAMSEAGVTDRGKRGKLDMLAASLMLQAYLDSERSGG